MLQILGDCVIGGELLAVGDFRHVQQVAKGDGQLLCKFRWFRSPHVPGHGPDITGWVPVSGATKPVYMPTVHDVGCLLKVTATPQQGLQASNTERLVMMSASVGPVPMQPAGKTSMQLPQPGAPQPSMQERNQLAASGLHPMQANASHKQIHRPEAPTSNRAHASAQGGNQDHISAAAAATKSKTMASLLGTLEGLSSRLNKDRTARRGILLESGSSKEAVPAAAASAGGAQTHQASTQADIGDPHLGAANLSSHVEELAVHNASQAGAQPPSAPAGLVGAIAQEQMPLADERMGPTHASTDACAPVDTTADAGNPIPKPQSTTNALTSLETHLDKVLMQQKASFSAMLGQLPPMQHGGSSQPGVVMDRPIHVFNADGVAHNLMHLWSMESPGSQDCKQQHDALDSPSNPVQQQQQQQVQAGRQLETEESVASLSYSLTACPPVVPTPDLPAGGNLIAPMPADSVNVCVYNSSGLAMSMGILQGKEGARGEFLVSENLVPPTGSMPEAAVATEPAHSVAPSPQRLPGVSPAFEFGRVLNLPIDAEPESAPAAGSQSLSQDDDSTMSALRQYARSGRQAEVIPFQANFSDGQQGELSKLGDVAAGEHSSESSSNSSSSNKVPSGDEVKAHALARRPGALVPVHQLTTRATESVDALSARHDRLLPMLQQAQAALPDHGSMGALLLPSQLQQQATLTDNVSNAEGNNVSNVKEGNNVSNAEGNNDNNAEGNTTWPDTDSLPRPAAVKEMSLHATLPDRLLTQQSASGSMLPMVASSHADAVVGSASAAGAHFAAWQPHAPQDLSLKQMAMSKLVHRSTPAAASAASAASASHGGSIRTTFIAELNGSDCQDGIPASNTMHATVSGQLTSALQQPAPNAAWVGMVQAAGIGSPSASPSDSTSGLTCDSATHYDSLHSIDRGLTEHSLSKLPSMLQPSFAAGYQNMHAHDSGPSMVTGAVKESSRLYRIGQGTAELPKAWSVAASWPASVAPLVAGLLPAAPQQALLLSSATASADSSEAVLTAASLSHAASSKRLPTPASHAREGKEKEEDEGEEALVEAASQNMEATCQSLKMPQSFPEARKALALQPHQSSASSSSIGCHSSSEQQQAAAGGAPGSNICSSQGGIVEVQHHIVGSRHPLPQAVQIDMLEVQRALRALDHASRADYDGSRQGTNFSGSDNDALGEPVTAPSSHASSPGIGSSQFFLAHGKHEPGLHEPECVRQHMPGSHTAAAALFPDTMARSNVHHGWQVADLPDDLRLGMEEVVQALGELKAVGTPGNVSWHDVRHARSSQCGMEIEQPMANVGMRPPVETSEPAGNNEACNVEGASELLGRHGNGLLVLHGHGEEPVPKHGSGELPDSILKGANEESLALWSPQEEAAEVEQLLACLGMTSASKGMASPSKAEGKAARQHGSSLAAGPSGHDRPVMELSESGENNMGSEPAFTMARRPSSSQEFSVSHRIRHTGSELHGINRALAILSPSPPPLAELPADGGHGGTTGAGKAAAAAAAAAGQGTASQYRGGALHRLHLDAAGLQFHAVQRISASAKTQLESGQQGFVATALGSLQQRQDAIRGVDENSMVDQLAAYRPTRAVDQSPVVDQHQLAASRTATERPVMRMDGQGFAGGSSGDHAQLSKLFERIDKLYQPGQGDSGTACDSDYHQQQDQLQSTVRSSQLITTSKQAHLKSSGSEAPQMPMQQVIARLDTDGLQDEGQPHAWLVQQLQQKAEEQRLQIHALQQEVLKWQHTAWKYASSWKKLKEQQIRKPPI